MKGKRPDYMVSTVVSSDSGDRWREIGVGHQRIAEEDRRRRWCTSG